MPEDTSVATAPQDANAMPDPVQTPAPTLNAAPTPDTAPPPPPEPTPAPVAPKGDANTTTDAAPPTWGDTNVGTAGILIVSLYLVLAFISLIYCLTRTWTKFDACAATPAVAGAGTQSLIPDIGLLCLVAIVGALGALIHAMRSFYAFVGNGQLKFCWLPMYFLLPFVGSALASVFFFILKGILSSGPPPSMTYTTTLGYLAVAGIVGLFTEETVVKIQEIAQTILGKKQGQKDPLDPTPVATQPVQPTDGQAG